MVEGEGKKGEVWRYGKTRRVLMLARECVCVCVAGRQGTTKKYIGQEEIAKETKEKEGS